MKINMSHKVSNFRFPFFSAKLCFFFYNFLNLKDSIIFLRLFLLLSDIGLKQYIYPLWLYHTYTYKTEEKEKVNPREFSNNQAHHHEQRFHNLFIMFSPLIHTFSAGPKISNWCTLIIVNNQLIPRWVGTYDYDCSDIVKVHTPNDFPVGKASLYRGTQCEARQRNLLLNRDYTLFHLSTSPRGFMCVCCLGF